MVLDSVVPSSDCLETCLLGSADTPLLLDDGVIHAQIDQVSVHLSHRFPAVQRVNQLGPSPVGWEPQLILLYSIM